MKLKRSLCVITILSILFCFSLAEARYNMVADKRIYRYSGYRAKHHFPYTLRITIVRDNRPRWERGYISGAQVYTYDRLWSQPVCAMMERILVREFKTSGMFTDVARWRKDTTLILKIKLNSFYGRVTIKKRWPREFPFNYIYGRTKLEATLVSRKSNKTYLKKNYKGVTSRKVAFLRNQYGHATAAAGRSFEKVVWALLRDVEASLAKGR